MEGHPTFVRNRETGRRAPIRPSSKFRRSSKDRLLSPLAAPSSVDQLSLATPFVIGKYRGSYNQKGRDSGRQRPDRDEGLHALSGMSCGNQARPIDCPQTLKAAWGLEPVLLQLRATPDDLKINRRRPPQGRPEPGRLQWIPEDRRGRTDGTDISCNQALGPTRCVIAALTTNSLSGLPPPI